MEPAATLAGVFIRMGSLIDSGKRVLSGLVHRFGALNFISDNVGCFGNKSLPRNGCLIAFGAHEVHVATEFVCKYLEHVLVAQDPPAVCAARGRRTTRPASCAVVLAKVVPAKWILAHLLPSPSGQGNRH